MHTYEAKIRFCLFPDVKFNLQELERKFSQTAAYANMKKMLVTKNDQMKELRKRLQAYEPDDTVAGDE